MDKDKDRVSECEVIEDISCVTLNPVLDSEE